VNINANLNHSTKMINSTFFQYYIIMLITCLLVIMVILSYYFEKKFVYEYLILGLLVIYVLYNLL
jgi:hypothetical protein